MPAAKFRRVAAGAGWVQASEMSEQRPQYDIPSLRARLACDGYLLLRDCLPLNLVLKARQVLLEELHAWRPACFAAPCPAAHDDAAHAEQPCSNPTGDARAAPGTARIGLLGRQDMVHHPAVAAVLRTSQLFSLMAALMQEDAVVTSDFAWLRAVAPGEFTGLHTDRVYVKGSARLLTGWIPLGAVPVGEGAMLVVRGSHRARAFAHLREGYGATALGADGANSGWLSSSGSDLQHHVGGHALDWRTTDLRAGDVVILHRDLLHMTARNVSGNVRLTCDTRWQPAADGRDPRIRVWLAQSDAAGEAAGEEVTGDAAAVEEAGGAGGEGGVTRKRSAVGAEVDGADAGGGGNPREGDAAGPRGKCGLTGRQVTGTGSDAEGGSGLGLRAMQGLDAAGSEPVEQGRSAVTQEAKQAQLRCKRRRKS